MSDYQQAKDMLLKTSRTFFIPINQLPPTIKEAVMSAYLCMRAIDEIEDTEDLSKEEKITLLNHVGKMLAEPVEEKQLADVFAPYQSVLPEVTLRLYDWITLSPRSAMPIILQSTAKMANGMAKWVDQEWHIETREDLDDYTFYVAGLVGILLSDLWEWYDGIKTDRDLAVGFGQGLQAVNIIRNRDEDLDRGVDFVPDGWTMEDMMDYARHNLALADQYTEQLQSGPIFQFCKIPLALAHGTLEVIERGEEKLSRDSVIDIVSQVVSQ